MSGDSNVGAPTPEFSNLGLMNMRSTLSNRVFPFPFAWFGCFLFFVHLKLDGFHCCFPKKPPKTTAPNNSKKEKTFPHFHFTPGPPIFLLLLPPPKALPPGRRCPFWLIWLKTCGRFLVYLVNQLPGKPIYFPKKTPMPQAPSQETPHFHFTPLPSPPQAPSPPPPVLPGPEHTAMALSAALAQQRRLEELRAEWLEQGLPEAFASTPSTPRRRFDETRRATKTNRKERTRV